jgi:CBS-domain-containing membrane protein
MQVEDVMTREVVTVDPQTSLKDVARLLVSRRVSGVPVVEADGTVVGVVSEADILLKECDRLGSTPLLGHLLDWDEDERAKYPARDAADAMTAPVVTIRRSRPVHEAAAMMLDRRVNRLPVVDEHNRLVGIVTRADLVRAFARTDEEIERDIREDVLLGTLCTSPDRLTIGVDHGEVTIDGHMADAESAALLRRLVERVPGVVDVRSRITW